MQHRSLALLEAERDGLELEIQDLELEINLSESLTEANAHIPALITNKSKLKVVQTDITCVKRAVDRLDEDYSIVEPSSKPVTKLKEQ